MELYVLGRNRCRRDVSNGAQLRIERRLYERIPQGRMSRRNSGSRLGGNEQVGTELSRFSHENKWTLETEGGGGGRSVGLVRAVADVGHAWLPQISMT